jgi:hypothetical protein
MAPGITVRSESAGLDTVRSLSRNREEKAMASEEQEVRDLNYAMERVISDAEHFVKDLKGQRHLKRIVMKDARHLRAHLEKLIERVGRLGPEHLGY